MLILLVLHRLAMASALGAAQALGSAHRLEKAGVVDHLAGPILIGILGRHGASLTVVLPNKNRNLTQLWLHRHLGVVGSVHVHRNAHHTLSVITVSADEKRHLVKGTIKIHWHAHHASASATILSDKNWHMLRWRGHRGRSVEGAIQIQWDANHARPSRPGLTGGTLGTDHRTIVRERAPSAIICLRPGRSAASVVLDGHANGPALLHIGHIRTLPHRFLTCTVGIGIRIGVPATATASASSSSSSSSSSLSLAIGVLNLCPRRSLSRLRGAFTPAIGALGV
mmetsp:Transcript_40102/g.85968  ORF Transcript_40102/g.85968 Transcript_40102/m.85968 type:complete len:282 (+) Transcript_40102:376-1221(+)